MHPVHSVVSASMPMLRVCSAVGKSLSLKLARGFCNIRASLLIEFMLFVLTPTCFSGALASILILVHCKLVGRLLLFHVCSIVCFLCSHSLILRGA